MLVIGHRGASAHGPENTIAAFKMALEKGCSGIELDVQLSKDEEVIVFHDYVVDRTTNGSGYVKDMTLKELKSLDTGTWFDESFVGERIPTLEEVLQAIPKGVLINIEIKNLLIHQGKIEKKVLDLVIKYDRMKDVIISSFDHYVLKNIRDLNKEIKIGLLIYANIIEPWSYIRIHNLDVYSIHPTEEYLSKGFVKDAHAHGYKVFSYTINCPDRAKEAYEMGVDAIFSNYPEII
ncbi:glycerophosphodiester phosphodiesterase [Alkaliphilus peptidifermentans]|uniref:Glycerophosphoryl diester phosphodiesterase n=1 Tax=Alkaliphilus peptidifermentans DSM 18978 TaxID=1120976 RepID=A0A1G5JMX0_9FIRM|nr:glycerophosphodiester phosphodiesterase [Alkaliphilus peptidifermentans]SCY89713.1 glycerophosphoryl diester phosphodiesterase [Alkaliphilus peptidifermentans DSM 18978]